MAMKNTVLYAIMLSAFIAMTFFISEPANANPMDERMFVGEWETQLDGEKTTITWNSDGTGEQTWEISTYYDMEFEWKIEDGQYWLTEKGYDDWYAYDYEFSDMYSKLTLSDEEGDIILERNGNVCCSACCGIIMLPAVALLPLAIWIRRR